MYENVLNVPGLEDFWFRAKRLHTVEVACGYLLANAWVDQLPIHGPCLLPATL